MLAEAHLVLTMNFMYLVGWEQGTNKQQREKKVIGYKHVVCVLKGGNGTFIFHFSTTHQKLGATEEQGTELETISGIDRFEGYTWAFLVIFSSIMCSTKFLFPSLIEWKATCSVVNVFRSNIVVWHK
jgi:hypothetical protein